MMENTWEAQEKAWEETREEAREAALEDTNHLSKTTT